MSDRSPARKSPASGTIRSSGPSTRRAPPCSRCKPYDDGRCRQNETPLATDTLETLYGIKEGNRLRLMAKKLGIPINKGFKQDVLQVEAAKTAIRFGPLDLRIAGPSKDQPEGAGNRVAEWLEEAAQKIATIRRPLRCPTRACRTSAASCCWRHAKARPSCSPATPEATTSSKESKAAGLLKKDKLHVDVLKVQHHGSNRNTTASFFNTITADTYVLSADGRHGNPKFNTMKWIVEGARARRQHITLVATNETEAIVELQKQLLPTDHGYTLRLLPEHQHSIEIPLGA